jgi:prophage maintenance system killer protein
VTTIGKYIYVANSADMESQIEQFIESIFPSQKPGQIKSHTGKLMSPEEMAKQKKEEKENVWDMVYLALAVFATLALVSGLMVNCPLYDCISTA